MSGIGLVDSHMFLGRAKKHMDALDALLKQFTGEKAYTLTRYDDLEQQRHCLKIKLHDVPDDICLTVGDLFYNMRSCLDQLVWSLAHRVGRILDPDYTQFPVMESYHRGDAYKAHPLWRLDAMCNLDKHRRIPANGSEIIPTFSNLTRGEVWGIQPIGPGQLAVEFPLDLRFQALDDCHIASVPLAAKHKLQLDPRIPFKVNFGG